MTPREFAIKKRKNGMVTSLALKPSNFDRKMKSYKYSILKTKVAGVFSKHHPSVFIIA